MLVEIVVGQCYHLAIPAHPPFVLFDLLPLDEDHLEPDLVKECDVPLLVEGSEELRVRIGQLQPSPSPNKEAHAVSVRPYDEGLLSVVRDLKLADDVPLQSDDVVLLLVQLEAVVKVSFLDEYNLIHIIQFFKDNIMPAVSDRLQALEDIHHEALVLKVIESVVAVLDLLVPGNPEELVVVIVEISEDELRENLHLDVVRQLHHYVPVLVCQKSCVLGIEPPELEVPLELLLLLV